MKTHTINLTNAAVSLLTNALGNTRPGWIKDIKENAIASRLLAETFVDFETKLAEKKIGNETIEVVDQTWAKEKHPEITVSEKERDVIKDCLRRLSEAKALPPGKPAFELITAFGLAEDR